MGPALDFAPLWLPEDETTVELHAEVRPADRVDGWNWQSLVLASLHGSRSKIASRVGLLIAILAYLSVFPTLARDNFFDLLRLTVWQAALLLVLLGATRSVRSISLAMTAVFWLAGFFVAPFAVHVIDWLTGLVPGVEDGAQRWIRPWLTVAAQVIPLVIATIVWPRRFRHPGASDLLVLGAAVGAGFTMHVEGLMDRVESATLLSDSHLVWTALLGAAIGLLALDRRDRLHATIAVVLAAVVAGDATILDLRWAPTALLVAVIGLTLTIDRRRAGEVGRRDHLFPEAPSHAQGVLIDRYRRLRAAVHTTLASRREHWPPVPGAPLAELARAGRAAGISVGRESSRNGWDRDPDDRSGLAHRFFGPNGWTTFTVDSHGVGQERVRARPDASVRIIDDLHRPPLSDPLVGDVPDRLPWFVGVGAAVALSTAIWLTGSTDLLDAQNLASLDSGSPLVRTFVGAVGATAAVVGRAQPTLGEPWELGPPDHHEV